jgi:hypothetical protein
MRQGATLPDMEPRPLTLADLDWVTGLAAARRARLVAFAPRFWNPSREARTVHAGFLGGLIGSPDVMAVRSEHGFLFGLPRRGRLFVDDMVIDDMVMADDARWPGEGAALLRHAVGATSPAALRFVCPVHELPRAEAARAVGLTVAESWWHRDLDDRPTTPAAPAAPAAELGQELGGELGEHCRLVPAPPVYDPGGPVLLVTTVPGAAWLADAERAAAARGATVSVVSQDPADSALAGLLAAAGYRRTTDYYVTSGPRRG